MRTTKSGLGTAMNPEDAPRAQEGKVYITDADGKRRLALEVTKVEAKANVKTEEVPRLGQRWVAHKAINGTLQLTMTAYKSTMYFDRAVAEFGLTGILPTFDVNVYSFDPSTEIGADSKTYRDCVIDGDVLLSMLDAEGTFITQEITMYANDCDLQSLYR